RERVEEDDVGRNLSAARGGDDQHRRRENEPAHRSVPSPYATGPGSSTCSVPSPATPTPPRSVSCRIAVPSSRMAYSWAPYGCAAVVQLDMKASVRRFGSARTGSM